MTIYSLPKAIKVRLSEIAQGECFMTTYKSFLDPKDKQMSKNGCNWLVGELFMCCEHFDKNTVYVVNLKTGIIDQFDTNFFVERVNASVTCTW